MITRRLALRLLVTMLTLGPGALVVWAESASAPLVVGVTVVRSCAIRATPTGGGLATVDLKCTAGAAVGLQTPRSTDIPTTPFRGTQNTDNVRVVTLNF